MSEAREDAAAGLERRLGPQATVSFDDTSGGVHMVARTNGTLTSPAKADPAAIALDYVRDREATFGLDAGGQHHDKLWEIFAFRGMGINAYSDSASQTTGVRAAFDMPGSVTAGKMGISDPVPLGDARWAPSRARRCTCGSRSGT